LESVLALATVVVDVDDGRSPDGEEVPTSQPWGEGGVPWLEKMDGGIAPRSTIAIAAEGWITSYDSLGGSDWLGLGAGCWLSARPTVLIAELWREAASGKGGKIGGKKDQREFSRQNSPKKKWRGHCLTQPADIQRAADATNSGGQQQQQQQTT